MRELELAEIGGVSGGQTEPFVREDGRLGTRVIGSETTSDPFATSITREQLLAAGYSSFGEYLEGSFGRVPPCGPSDFGPCQLPSGNYVIDGVVHAETTGNLPGEDIDWLGVGTDLTTISTSAAGGMGAASIGAAIIIPIGSGAATIEELRNMDDEH